MKTLERAQRWLRLRTRWARQRWSFVDNLALAYDRYCDVLAGRLAAAIAYYGFFACYALVLLAFSALGFVARYDPHIQDNVQHFLRLNLPWIDPTLPVTSRGQTGLIGLIGLLVTGVGWIETIRSSQRLIHRVEQQPGHPIKRYLVDVGVLIAMVLLVGLSLTAFYALESLVTWIAGGPSALISGLGYFFAVLLNLLLAAYLLVGVPRLRLSRWRLLPSVLFVGTGVTLLNTVGQALIRHTRHNPAYAVVTAAVALLLYLYLFNQLLLFGAALAATSPYGRVRDLAAGRTVSG